MSRSSAVAQNRDSVTGALDKLIFESAYPITWSVAEPWSGILECFWGSYIRRPSRSEDDLLWERSGSLVECLTRDRGASGSSLTGVTALCPI